MSRRRWLLLLPFALFAVVRVASPSIIPQIGIIFGQTWDCSVVSDGALETWVKAANGSRELIGSASTIDLMTVDGRPPTNVYPRPWSDSYPITVVGPGLHVFKLHAYSIPRYGDSIPRVVTLTAPTETGKRYVLLDRHGDFGLFEQSE